MACRFTYKGKTYTQDELVSVLRNITPSEAAPFIPDVTAVPDAPFIGSTDAWASIALKRMIRWASEHGYDRIAWTPGDVQAERYDLSKQIGKVEFADNSSGGIGRPRMGGEPSFGTLTAYDLNGRRVIDRAIDPEKIEDYIGKDLAKKLLEQTPKEGRMAGFGVRVRELSGLDLKVGGEGMKGFYDSILVAAANKLGKKFGAKVGKISIGKAKIFIAAPWGFSPDDWGVLNTDHKILAQGGLSKSDAEAMAERLNREAMTAHSLDITPAMRTAAMGGMPLFKDTKLSPTSFVVSKKQLMALNVKAQALSRRINGRNLDVSVVEKMPDFVPKDFIAAYSPSQRAVWLSLKAASDMAFNIGHESLHSLRQTGAITTDEWKVLTKAAAERGYVDNLSDERIAIYTKEYRGRYGMTERQMTDAMVEEAVADMFGDYINGQEMSTPVARIFARIREFIESLLSLLKGEGLATADTIMGAASRGSKAGMEVDRTAGPQAVMGSSRDITKTDAFKRWFGDSKVVDENGEPLVVYHGTRNSFDTFDKEKQERQRFYGPGFYFAEDPDVAGGMGRWSKMEDVENAASFNLAGFAWQGAQFKLTRPLTDADVRKVMRRLDTNAVLADARSDMGIAQHRHDLYLAAKQGPEELARILARDPGWGILELLKVERERTTAANVMPVYLSIKNPANSVAEVGPEHDGLHIAEKGYWIAFEPNQIKSAIGNSGAFDPENPSILGNAQAGGSGPVSAVNPFDVAADAESREALEDLAGNINLRYINEPDDVKDALREIASRADGFINARRGVISNNQTRQLAAELGMNYKELMKRQHGDAFNAESIFAARVLLLKSTKRILSLASQANRSGSMADLVEFHKAFTRHAAIQEQVAGLTAEAGRALQQFRMLAGDDYFRSAKAIMDQAQHRKEFGPDAVRNLAAMIDTMNDPAQVGKFTREAFKVTIWDMLREIWINSILSGLRTQVTNILSNTLTAAWQVPETALASMIGQMHKGDRVHPGEAMSRLVGLIEGTKDGLLAARMALKTGEPADFASKIETHRKKAIPGLAGEIVRTPGRMLLAADELFKTVNYRAEINALSLRLAAKEGLQGKDLLDRAAEFRAEPTKAMERQAHEAALYHTFQTPLGPAGQAVMNLRDRVWGGYIILPFIRTPANIIKYAAERTPLGLLMRHVRENISGANGNVARDTQMARLALGSAIAATVASLAMAGLVTGGGPDDDDEKSILRATGWQPYSVKIGDTWYSYQRFDPFAFIVGVVADTVDLSEALSEAQFDQMAAMVAGSISGNLLDKTWLSGPSDFINAVTDPGRYGSYYIRKLAGSAVPTIVAHWAQTTDPVMRDARTMLDQIKARIPYVSASLPPRRNVFGEEIRYEGSLGPDMLSAVFTSTEKDNPVAKAILDSGYYPSMPRREINKHPLNSEQYDKYSEMAGKEAVRRLTPVVTRSSWQNLKPDRQEKIIRKAFDDARDQARDKMKRLYPELRKK